MRSAPAGPAPWTKLVSWLLMVIWVSVRLGRTGPRNCTWVGRLWPNTLTSPGPDTLRLGVRRAHLDDLASHGDRLLRGDAQRDADGDGRGEQRGGDPDQPPGDGAAAAPGPCRLVGPLPGRAEQGAVVVRTGLVVSVRLAGAAIRMRGRWGKRGRTGRALLRPGHPAPGRRRGLSPGWPWPGQPASRLGPRPLRTPPTIAITSTESTRCAGVRHTAAGRAGQVGTAEGQALSGQPKERSGDPLGNRCGPARAGYRHVAHGASAQ